MAAAKATAVQALEAAATQLEALSQAAHANLYRRRDDLAAALATKDDIDNDQ